jgi:hypothetical protein
MIIPERRPRVDRSEAAFDRGLTAAARSLVLAPLPAAVLEVPRPVTARSSLWFQAPLAASVAIVVVALGLAVGAPQVPGVSKTPAFRTGNEISYELRSSGYACRSGADASPGRPRMEAIVCTTVAPSLVATVIVSEDATGRVGELHGRVDLDGAPTGKAERDRSALLRGLIGLPFADPSDAAAGRAWLSGLLPLDPGKRAGTAVGGTQVVVERDVGGGYLVVLGDLHADGSTPPPT